MYLKAFFYLIFQILWCMPQNLTGGILYLIYCRKQKPRYFRGAMVFSWKRNCCTSLGMFIFMEERAKEHRPLLLHEYGHTIQSDLLGWLYLPVMFLPSVIWFSCFENFRKRKHWSYYGFYTEASANLLAEKICHEKPIQ